MSDPRTESEARRLDTSLESEGAEFLVLGNLLVEGIQAFKAYTNFPGYDLIATNAEKNLSCRIQVKSRFATDFDGGFPIKNLDCDFVVFVALNRGYRYRRKKHGDDTGRRDPDFYVFPVEVVREARRPESTWNKVFLRHMDGAKEYVSRWDLIRSYLELEG
ncbi:MAG: hypothetical protein ACRDSJ_13560 [Rubrobacteraceae bacterium]